MGADMELYLRATPTIDADNENIIEAAKRLTAGYSSDQRRCHL
jgi:hypothetical protein